MTDKFLFPSSQHSLFPHLSAAPILLHPQAPLEGWSFNISLPLVEWWAELTLTSLDKAQWQIHEEKYPQGVTESQQGIQSLLINSDSSATDQIHLRIPPWTQRGEKSIWSREREGMKSSQEFTPWAVIWSNQKPGELPSRQPVGRHPVMASQGVGSQKWQSQHNGESSPPSHSWHPTAAQMMEQATGGREGESTAQDQGE